MPIAYLEERLDLVSHNTGDGGDNEDRERYASHGGTKDRGRVFVD
jgi:hypothetical protein